MLDNRGAKLLLVCWAAFLGGFTFLAYSDFALIYNTRWCGASDENCFREWLSASSGWFASFLAAATLFFLFRQIKESTRSVDVALETLQENRRSTERQLRAYVYAGQTPYKIEDGLPVMTLEITNHGATPAHNVSIDRMVYVAATKEYRDFSSSMITHLGSLGPGQTRYSRTVLPRKTYEAHRGVLASGKNRVHLYTILTYEDAFGANRETRFRLISPNKGDTPYMRISEAIKAS